MELYLSKARLYHSHHKKRKKSLKFGMIRFPLHCTSRSICPCLRMSTWVSHIHMHVPVHNPTICCSTSDPLPKAALPNSFAMVAIFSKYIGKFLPIFWIVMSRPSGLPANKGPMSCPTSMEIVEDALYMPARLLKGGYPCRKGWRYNWSNGTVFPINVPLIVKKRYVDQLMFRIVSIHMTNCRNKP